MVLRRVLVNDTLVLPVGPPLSAGAPRIALGALHCIATGIMNSYGVQGRRRGTGGGG